MSTTKFISKIFIRGSIDDVWREITKTDEPQGAMFGMQMHTDGLKLGGQIRMRTTNGRYTGVVGEILELDPPYRYAHTFRFTQYDDAACTIRYELAEVDGGVEFTLSAEDVPVDTKTAKQLKSGGGFICKNLKHIVERGSPTLLARIVYRVFRLLEFTSPKSTRSEHWPLGKSL